MMNQKKFVVFDINHTLIHDNSWAQLNVAFGMTPGEDEMLWNLNQEGILDNETWVKIVNALFRSRGMATVENAKRAVLGYQFIDGAVETVKTFQSEGYTVILQSGGMDLLVRDVAEKLEVNEWYHGADLEFDVHGNFVEMHYPDQDSFLKLTQIQMIADKHGVETSEIICVGDGANEAEIFKICRGVTFEGSRLEPIAWKVVPSINEVADVIIRQ